MASTTDKTETPWFDAFPEPRQKSPSKITKESLLGELEEEQVSGRQFLLIDVRKNDYEGGTVRGALNLPAQSIYHALPTLLEVAKNANIGRVIFYCGSSGGRGTRCAGWFDDLLSDQDVSNVQSLILAGGIKGWALAGKEYTDLMVDYHAGPWEQFRT